MSLAEQVAVWLGALVTLAVFSYLAKDNPVYRLVQQAALGVMVGVGVVVAWQQVLHPMWWSNVAEAYRGTKPATGYLWLLALVPGSLWYFQLSKRYFWLSTLVSGLFIGVAAGLAFKTQIILIMPQIAGSLRLLNPFAGDGHFTWSKLLHCFSNVVFLVALLTTLLYFFFSVRTDSPLLRTPMRVGRIMIMLALGAMFGSTVMTRMAYLIERLGFLYDQWLGPLVGAG